MRLSAQLLVVCAVLCAVLAQGCRWFEAPPLAQGTVESHVAEASAAPIVLGAGDRITVQVLLHPEHSTPPEGARLDPEGRIDLPLVGPVLLAGLSIDEARARLRDEVAHFVRDPKLTLNVLELVSRRAYVFGEVPRNGPILLDRPLNALQLLSLAGGFLPGADRHQVALLRGSRDRLEVYFFDGATPGPDGMVAVRPDDLVFVRLSGAGTFRDQILPVVQSLVPPIAALASLIVVADQLNQ